MSVIGRKKIAKIVFAGPSNVGKSSIIYRFDNDNLPDMSSTIGAAFIRKQITNNNETILLHIWDTAGQERYQAMSKMYFRGADYCILTFDLSDSESFKKMDIWKQICDSENNIKSPIYVLVGNKSDKKIGITSEEEIREYCRINNITFYFETSAYTGEGICFLYNELVKHICANHTGTNLYPFDTKLEITAPILNKIPPSRCNC